MRESTEFTSSDSDYEPTTKFLLKSMDIKDKESRRALLKYAVEHDLGHLLRAIHDAAVFTITSEIWDKFVLPLAMRSSVKDEIKLGLLVQTKSTDTLKLVEAAQTTDISMGAMRNALNDLLEVGNDIFAASLKFVSTNSDANHVAGIGLYITEYANELIGKTDFVADYINKGNQLSEEERGKISELFYRIFELKDFVFAKGKEDAVCQVIQRVLEEEKIVVRSSEGLTKSWHLIMSPQESMEIMEKMTNLCQPDRKVVGQSSEELAKPGPFILTHELAETLLPDGWINCRDMDAREMDAKLRAEEPLAAALDFAQKQRYKDMDARDIDAKLRAKESLAAALDFARKQRDNSMDARDMDAKLEESPKVLPDGMD